MHRYGYKTDECGYVVQIAGGRNPIPDLALRRALDSFKKAIKSQENMAVYAAMEHHAQYLGAAEIEISIASGVFRDGATITWTYKHVKEGNE